MKKITLFLATIMMLVMANMPMYASSASPFAGGDGSEGNPYIIENESDFSELFTIISTSQAIQTSGKYYIVMNDVSLNNAQIKYGSFYGNLNGNGKKITISNVDSLFGSIGSGGIVSDLVINGTAKRASFATYNYGNIIDCCSNVTVSSNISVKYNDGGSCYGGIVAANYGEIIRCINYGNVGVSGTIGPISNSDSYVSSSTSVGGIAGKNSGLISECANYGNLSNKIVRNRHASVRIYISDISNSETNTSKTQLCYSRCSVDYVDRDPSGSAISAYFSLSSDYSVTKITTYASHDDVLYYGGSFGSPISSSLYKVKDVNYSDESEMKDTANYLNTVSESDLWVNTYSSTPTLSCFAKKIIYQDEEESNVVYYHPNILTAILDEEALHREGKVLIGWIRNNDITYQPNDVINLDEKELTLIPIWNCIFINTIDGGYYTKSDINPMSDITSGIMAFSSVYNYFEENKDSITNYGFLVYNPTNEDKKVTVESDSLDNLNKANGKFTTYIPVPINHFKTQVVAKPFVIISGDTVWGDAMITSVAQIDKWLGSKTNTPQ